MPVLLSVENNSCKWSYFNKLKSNILLNHFKTLKCFFIFIKSWWFYERKHEKTTKMKAKVRKAFGSLINVVCLSSNGSESWSGPQLCGITRNRWWIYPTKTWYSSVLLRAQRKLMLSCMGKGNWRTGWCINQPNAWLVCDPTSELSGSMKMLLYDSLNCQLWGLSIF